MVTKNHVFYKMILIQSLTKMVQDNILKQPSFNQNNERRTKERVFDQTTD